MMTSFYKWHYLELLKAGDFHVRFLDTFQGRCIETTNGCAVIACLMCMHYLTSQDKHGIKDSLVKHIIDVESVPILLAIRRKSSLESDSYLVPYDVNDYLIDNERFSPSQFLGAPIGNILDNDHMHCLISFLLEKHRLHESKIAATLYFCGHIVALHLLKRNEDDTIWIELIDSLPNTRAWGQEDGGNRVICKFEHFETLIRHYACSKFSEEETAYIESTAWDDNQSVKDPRLFQCFVWTEKSVAESVEVTMPTELLEIAAGGEGGTFTFNETEFPPCRHAVKQTLPNEFRSAMPVVADHDKGDGNCGSNSDKTATATVLRWPNVSSVITKSTTTDIPTKSASPTITMTASPTALPQQTEKYRKNKSRPRNDPPTLHTNARPFNAHTPTKNKTTPSKTTKTPNTIDNPCRGKRQNNEQTPDFRKHHEQLQLENIYPQDDGNPTIALFSDNTESFSERQSIPILSEWQPSLNTQASETLDKPQQTKKYQKKKSRRRPVAPVVHANTGLSLYRQHTNQTPTKNKTTPSKTNKTPNTDNPRHGKRQNNERTPAFRIYQEEPDNIDPQDDGAPTIALFRDNTESLSERQSIPNLSEWQPPLNTQASEIHVEEIRKLCQHVEKANSFSKKEEEAIDDFVYAYLETKLNADVVRIKPKMSSRRIWKSYIKLPQPQSLRPNSNDESYSRTTVNRKVELVERYLTLITQGNGGILHAMLEKLASARGFDLVRSDFQELDVVDTAVIQEAIGCSANAMQRLKSVLESVLGRRIFPSCLRARLSEFGKEAKIEVETDKVKLIITGTDTEKKERSFNYLKRPMDAIQTIIEASKTVGTYRDSFTLSSLSNTCICTLNIDKGNDIISGSVSCRNVKHGNSGDKTMHFATVDGGKVCECSANLKQTFFNTKYPIKKFINQFTGEKLWILTVVLPSNETKAKYFKTIIFESANEPKLDNSSFKSDFVIETDNTYPTESGEAPFVDTVVDGLVVKLVKNVEKKCITGVVISCDGNMVLAQKFRQPIKIDEIAVDSNFTAEMERVIGFPVNDMKMQLTLIGVSSASCTHGCPACSSDHSRFKLIPASLLEIMKTLKHPCISAFKARDETMDRLRKNESSPVACKVRHDELIKTISYCDAAKEKAYISKACLSVSQDVYLEDSPPEKNNGDGLHNSSGLLNHFFESVRKYLIKIDSYTFDDAQAMLVQVQEDLNKYEVSKKGVNDIGNNIGMKMKEDHSKKMKEKSLMITNFLRYNELRRLVDKTAPPKELRFGKKFTKEELGWSDELIDSKIAALRTTIESGPDEQIENLDTTESTHHAQLLHGLRTLVGALTKYLSGSSKRAHGKLEYMFDLALQTIGGGSFSAEHGGREQTNGKAMISIEKFDEIMDVCIASIADESDYKDEVTQQLDLFKTAGRSLYKLTKLMKQQEKLDPKDFDLAVASFLLNLEAACPGMAYYNKIHFLASHVTEFVREYKCYGLLSAEGHESKHASFAKRTAVARYMGNDGKKFAWMMSKEFMKHDSRVVRRTAEVAKKGKPRGSYKVAPYKNWSNRRDDGADSENTVKHGNEQFFRLPGDTGIIPYCYKDMSMYLISNTMIPSWKNDELERMMDEHSFRRSVASRW
jgi:hypothetical protein